MSLERTNAKGASVLGTFNSSGNFAVPAGVNKVFVMARGASGGSTNQSGGLGVYASGYVAVTPGSTVAVAVGAAGNSGNPNYSSGRYITFVNGYNAANAGGNTTFDGNAVISYGGSAAVYNGAGSNGSAAFDSTLPLLYPAGANARVTGGTQNNTTNSGAGQVVVFGWA